MENTPTQQVVLPVKSKERSAAYPAITIEDALKFVSEIYKNFRNNPTKRDDILALIEGAQNRYIAAATYYLLLKREKDNYQVSELYKTISAPLSTKERSEALLISFAAPKLNRQLIDKFDGDEIPKELVVHLSRFHEITEDAAPVAADVFIKNAKYCGVLTENNYLRYKLVSAKLDFIEDKVDNGAVEVQAGKVEHVETLNTVKEKIIESETKKDTLLLPEMVNSDKIRIRLTGGRFAYLIHPLDLNIKDITILQKQLEQLQLIAERQ